VPGFHITCLAALENLTAPHRAFVVIPNGFSDAESALAASEQQVPRLRQTIREANRSASLGMTNVRWALGTPFVEIVQTFTIVATTLWSDSYPSLA
jgi:hypothetical protein